MAAADAAARAGGGGKRRRLAEQQQAPADWDEAYSDYYAQYDPAVGFLGRYLPPLTCTGNARRWQASSSSKAPAAAAEAAAQPLQQVGWGLRPPDALHVTRVTCMHHSVAAVRRRHSISTHDAAAHAGHALLRLGARVWQSADPALPHMTTMCL